MIVNKEFYATGGSFFPADSCGLYDNDDDGAINRSTSPS